MKVQTDSLDWQREAACKTTDQNTQLAFTGGISNVVDAQPLVWEFCADCPVRSLCRDWAEKQRVFTGIAGGYLWKSTGQGSDYTKGVRVEVPAVPGVLTGWNRKVHAKLRRQHWVSDVQPRVWGALCGATLTITKGTAEEKGIESAPMCVQCERMKPNAKRGTVTRRRTA